tara:strand:+ start:65 stop:478 length:414 start_codon:yes stop_codon:yes gene_type:complete
MYKKNNVRTAYKTSRRTSYKKSGGFQGYKSRNKGNISQQYNKYLKLAKEAFRSGDRVQSEYYYQFTDHYYRLMIELGINVDEGVTGEENKDQSNIDSNGDNSAEDQASASTDHIKDNVDSIETIKFIAQPSKDKKTS